MYTNTHTHSRCHTRKHTVTETTSLPFYSHRTFLTNANFSIILFYILCCFFFHTYSCVPFSGQTREAFSYGYEALFVSVETCARCNRKLLTSFRSILIQLILFTQTQTHSNERNRIKAHNKFGKIFNGNVFEMKRFFFLKFRKRAEIDESRKVFFSFS